MVVTDEMVRCAVVAQKHNKSDLVYKCVFDGNNFFVYRRVYPEFRYQGRTYNESGWALSWCEVNEVILPIQSPPTFVADSERVV